MPEKRILMKGQKFLVLFVLAAVLFSFISGCAGVERIDSFFANNEYQSHSKLIDFGLFFVMFFALCYLGLTKVWGEGYGKPGSGKGPIVGLSLALSLALAFAIVTQTGFSITSIFPMAKAIFFIIIWFLLWGLLDKTKMLGEGWGAKVAYAILAAIIVYLLASIFTHMVCQMGDNMDDSACSSDFFNAAFTMTDRWFDWGTGGGGGGGGQGTGGGGTGEGGAGEGGATGEIRGGCRLDVMFGFDDSGSPSGANLQAYVNAVKAMGKTSIHAYGFASDEGREKYNVGLASRRANRLKEMIQAIDSSIRVSPSGKGPTKVFDPSAATGEGSSNANRRVVLSTDTISRFMPAPAIGALSPGCPEQAGEAGAQAGVAAEVGKGEQAVPAGQAGAAGGPQQPGGVSQAGIGGWLSNWYIWIIIPLLLLLLWMGGVKTYNYVQTKRVYGNRRRMNDDLERLIRHAVEKLVAITNTLQQVPTGLDQNDTVLFSKAVSDTSYFLRARINNHLGLNPPGVGTGAPFAPGFTGSRSQLARDVFDCVDSMRKARSLTQRSIKNLFWPLIRRVNRLSQRINNIAVSPIVHDNGTVSFFHMSNAPVDVVIERPVVAAGPPVPPIHRANMNNIPGTWRFMYTTPNNLVLGGTYHYIYIEDPAGAAVLAWDALNLNRTSNNNQPAANDRNILIAQNVRARQGQLNIPNV